MEKVVYKFLVIPVVIILRSVVIAIAMTTGAQNIILGKGVLVQSTDW